MRRGITGNIHHGGMLTRRHSRKNELDAKRRRAILHGYPSEIKFTSIDDENNYFDNEKIVCLLCGKLYKFLSLHLVVHSIGVDEYKRRFNITLDRGLVGKNIYKNMQLKTKERNNTDLKEAIENYRESLPENTHCFRGHKFVITKNNNKYCRTCSTTNTRNKFNRLPRKLANNTLVDMPCDICGEMIKRSKTSSRGYCNPCKKNKYYESQKKYNETNRVKRRLLAKIAREKRIKKND